MTQARPATRLNEWLVDGPTNVPECCVVQEWLDGVLAWTSLNKEWLFSGIGVLLLSGVVSVFRSRETKIVKEIQIVSAKDSDAWPVAKSDSLAQKDYWMGISPAKTKYVQVAEISDSIPIGIQTFDFEFSPNGHAHELQMRGSIACAHIQFTCQIKNIMKTMASGNDYALNFLCPRFMVIARGILEATTISSLRDRREEFASRILEAAQKEFVSYGIELRSVSLGDIKKL